MTAMKIASDEVAPTNPGGAYCPRIYLSDDQVEALGIKAPPLPGKVYHLKVVAEAVSVTATKEEGDEKSTEGNAPDVCLTLDLTDIEIVDSGKSAAEVLYGNK